MNQLIIGNGEVGTALAKILSDYGVVIIEKDGRQWGEAKEFEAMHICFPYSEEFISEVKRYQKLHTPKYTIIHSSIPVGTSRKCGALHSPIIGIHPHLEYGIKTFTKFIGGEKASEVADIFRRAGIKVYLCKNQEDTELMKLLDTTKYALDIEYTKDVKKQCDKYNIPFELWTLWINNYNSGYQQLGYPEYTRPNLVPIMKEQGGHCTIPNCDLFETEFTKFIKEMNSKYADNKAKESF